jgi:hypothetical protein
LKLAILFWIYREPEICRDRAELLRRLNPELPLYVLYGGQPDDADAFRQALDGLHDDFYAFPMPWSAQRKWMHGDQLLAAWFRDRGADLEWDTVFIAQWDMLLLAPLTELCAHLRAEQILLPGLRPIREVADWWWWTRPGSEEGAEYARFRASLGAAFPLEPLCCNFLAAALPRSFLSRYGQISDPDLGFLEYKLPVYAQVWGYSFCQEHPFNPVWRRERRLNRLRNPFDTLHAEKGQVPEAIVRMHAMAPWGRRVFHPFVSRFVAGSLALSAERSRPRRRRRLVKVPP